MLEAPAPHDDNPLRLILQDIADDRAATVPWPPGPRGFSLPRTRQYARNPLPLMIDLYERHGPVYTLKVLHFNVVMMLGPEANHYMLVSNASNFRWREGHMRDLIPLLGDGLLTIDGTLHRSSRKMMLPAFHREKIASATEIIEEEVAAATATLVPGQVIDLYDWTRHLALRIAMRALFGLDPDLSRAGDFDAAHEFEAALSFHARDVAMQLARGPGTPYAQVLKSRQRLDELVYAEIAGRRQSGRRGDDVLSLLLDATFDDGTPLSDKQVRDHVMTLLFAGHDTTTSTVAFMFYELSRNPGLLEDPRITPEMVLDETLRMYPPAYIGPRRSVEPYEFAGVSVPGNVHVNYCSWASHHLPDVWDEPERFDPLRFTAEGKAALRKGQYIPFGGGSRTCIGMRFGQAEIGVILRSILERYRLELLPGFELDTRLAPTLSPRNGMPMTVRAAGPAPILDSSSEPAVEPAAA
ncbi:MAG: cytochrome P450 [Solirubrobacteraceae bacterium]|nr:cytochrome P450 [Solirubrobacteraceae bacterium]